MSTADVAKLFADLLGCKKEGNSFILETGTDEIQFMADGMTDQFDTSWDWLMPVVKWINSGNWPAEGDKIQKDLGDAVLSGDLDNAYLIAVEFGLWWKRQNEPEARIWTTFYRPFTMGGSPNRPVATIVAVEVRKTINGIAFFSFRTPKGSLRIADVASGGGIVAESWEELEHAIDGVDLSVLQAQSAAGKAMGDQAEIVSNEVFFTTYKS